MPQETDNNEKAEIVVGGEVSRRQSTRRQQRDEDLAVALERRVRELEDEKIGAGEEFVRTRGIDFARTPRIIRLGLQDTLSTGDGKDFFPITDFFDGHRIVSARAVVGTAGNDSADTTIQVHNLTDSVDVFSTLLTIDSGEKDSKNSATTVVINKSNNQLQRGDVLRLDIDAIDGGGGERDLSVILETALPESPLRATNF